MFPTAAAPANDPKNNDRSSGTLDLRQSEIMANIASPAPTLSTTFVAKAGQ